jgi:2'-5' RNA ligase
MAYAVELNFDPVVEERIRALWRRLAGLGVGSLMSANGASPHVTLAVYDEVDELGIERRLRAFARDEPRIVLTFALAGTFPGPAGVVFLAPAPTRTLLGLHARWHAGCADLVSWVHYRPDFWVPHCTLAKEAAADNIGEGVALARELAFPLTAEMQSVSLVRFVPVVELLRFPLRDA